MFLVKMTKCHQMYTPGHAREGVVNTPTGHRSKLLLVTRSSLTPREEPSDILNGPGFDRFAGDYD